MIYTRYTYSLPEEDFYQFLADHSEGVEVIKREGKMVFFATYKELKDQEPLKVEKLSVKSPEGVLKSVKVGTFLVVPPRMKILIINPGMAFGTGFHPTTQLSLMLIEEFFKKGWSAIDVGCGSGILALALKKCLASEVLAIDVDEKAIKECKKNARVNRLRIKCLQATPKDIKDSFDFLTANLELGIFRSEMKYLLPIFKRRAVFSGIYGKDELDEFLDMLEGLRVTKIRKLKGWYGVVVER